MGELAPDLPAELEKLISRCLRKDRDRRPQHVGDIKLALEELRDDSASGKLSSSAKAGAQAPARKSVLPAAMLAGAAVLLAATGVLWWLKRSPAAPPRSYGAANRDCCFPRSRMVVFTWPL